MKRGMTNMSNVYKRLQHCRAELKKLPIKESGENKFAGYKYMELGDCLPHIVDLCEVNGLCTIVSFQEDATLTIINSDKPEEQIIFHSPMSTAELKGCHAIQNLGAVETYLRRYLYVNAFDIVEHDALDSTHGKDNPENKKEAVKSPAQSNVVSPADQEYIERTRTALKAIFGDNKERALNKIEEMTSFIPKDKTEADRVKGVRDYTKLKGKRLEILVHNLEKMVPKETDPIMCNTCGGLNGDHTPDCPDDPNNDIPL